jgi:hypothetical protein
MLNPFDSLSPAAGLALYGLGLTTLAAVICGLSLALLLQTGWASRLALDHPNARSLHEEVVPRCGGWGILGTLLVILAATSPSLWRLIAALCVLVVVSFLDDRQGMPILLRFGAQVLALLVVLSGYPQTLPWWVLAVSALAWLWGTNLYNFMDGADMMAGTMTVTGFAAYAAASATDNVSLTTVCLVASGSALGFLWFNRPPARLFLGDVGSIRGGRDGHPPAAPLAPRENLASASRALLSAPDPVGLQSCPNDRDLGGGNAARRTAWPAIVALHTPLAGHRDRRLVRGARAGGRRDRPALDAPGQRGIPVGVAI